jgi:hypothetical protein
VNVGVADGRGVAVGGCVAVAVRVGDGVDDGIGTGVDVFGISAASLARTAVSMAKAVLVPETPVATASGVGDGWETLHPDENIRSNETRQMPVSAIAR